MEEEVKILMFTNAQDIEVLVTNEQCQASH
jgi:hypothetical protein